MSKVILRDKALRKTKANTKTSIDIKNRNEQVIRKPSRIWSDKEGKFVEMTEDDHLRYQLHQRNKAMRAGEKPKKIVQDVPRAKWSKKQVKSAIDNFIKQQ